MKNFLALLSALTLPVLASFDTPTTSPNSPSLQSVNITEDTGGVKLTLKVEGKRENRPEQSGLKTVTDYITIFADGPLADRQSLLVDVRLTAQYFDTNDKVIETLTQSVAKYGSDKSKVKFTLNTSYPASNLVTNAPRLISGQAAYVQYEYSLVYGYAVLTKGNRLNNYTEHTISARNPVTLKRTN